MLSNLERLSTWLHRKRIAKRNMFINCNMAKEVLLGEMEVVNDSIKRDDDLEVYAHRFIATLPPLS